MSEATIQTAFSNINEGKYNTFIIDKKFNLSGSVMSLVDMGNKTVEIPQSSHGCFANLFEEKPMEFLKP